MELDVQISSLKKKPSSTCYRINEVYKRKVECHDCPTCGKSFNHYSSLKRHFKTHLAEYMYVPTKKRHDCPTCGKSFNHYSSLKRHFKTHLAEYVPTKKPAEVGKFACDMCGKVYVHKNSLWRHIQSHEPVDYVCEGCGKLQLNYVSNYRHRKQCKSYQDLHLRRKSTAGSEIGRKWIETTEEYLAVYKHKCQMCGERFCIREQLDRHVEHCGDQFWLKNATDPDKLLREGINKAFAEKKRKSIVKMAKQSFRQKRKRWNKKSEPFERIGQMNKVKKYFPTSITRNVANVVKKKYDKLRVLFGKKAYLMWLRRQVHNRKLRCRQIFKRDSLYKCSSCVRMCKGEPMVVAHLRSLHKVRKPLLCTVCLKDFHSLQDFRFHQLLHAHKLGVNALFIKYAISVKDVHDQHYTSNTLKSDEKMVFKPRKPEDNKSVVEPAYSVKYLCRNYKGKCLCGMVAGNMEQLIFHVQKVHGMILAFKCKHCLRDRMFQNTSDLFRHMESQHNKTKVDQADFEENFLMPASGQNSSKSFNMLSKQQSSFSSLLEEQTATSAREAMIDQEIARIDQFLKLTEGKMSQENKVSVKISQTVKKIDGRGRKRDLLQSKKLLRANDCSATKEKRNIYNTIMEKNKDTSGKLRAKLIVRKYKAMSGWNCRKDIKRKVYQVHLRNMAKTKKSRFILWTQPNFKYQCSVCQSVFVNAQNVICHLSKRHKKKSVLECSVCKKTFFDLTSISMHQYQHNSAKIDISINILYTSLIKASKTSQTETKSKNKETLRLLNGIYPSRCHLCKKMFDSRSFLNHHVRSTHNLIFGYKCKLCDQTLVFEEFSEFYNHINQAHMKVNICTDDFEQISVIKVGDTNQNSKAVLFSNSAFQQEKQITNVGSVRTTQRSTKTETVSEPVKYPSITETRSKRQIRPKFDPAFQYGVEPAIWCKRQTDQTGSYNKMKDVREHGVNVKVEQVETREEYCCIYCGKEFRYKIMLHKHTEKEHEQEVRRDKLEEKSNKISQLKANPLGKNNLLLGQYDASNPSLFTLKAWDCNKGVESSDASDHTNIVKHSVSTQKCKRNESTKHTDDSQRQKSKIIKLRDRFENEDLDIYSGDSDQSDTAGFEDEMKAGEHVSKEKDNNKVNSDRNRLDSMQFFCPYCTTKTSSTVYEEIRDHIKEKHSDTRISESGQLSQNSDQKIHIDHKSRSSDTATDKHVDVVTCQSTIGNVAILLRASTDSGAEAGSSQINIGTRLSQLKSFPLKTADDGAETGSSTTTDEGVSNRSSSRKSCRSVTATGDSVVELNTVDTHDSNAEQANDLCEKTKSKNSTLQQTRGQVQKKFVCTVCDMRFHTEFHRNIHRLEHTGDNLQQFVCGLCAFSYSNHRNLRRHMVVHRKHGHFRCHQCSRQFDEQGDLDRHVKTHVDAKPHKCRICGNRYCNLISIKKHIKQKHPECGEKWKTVVTAACTGEEANEVTQSTDTSVPGTSPQSVSGQKVNDVSGDSNIGKENSTKLSNKNMKNSARLIKKTAKDSEIKKTRVRSDDVHDKRGKRQKQTPRIDTPDNANTLKHPGSQSITEIKDKLKNSLKRKLLSGSKDRNETRSQEDPTDMKEGEVVPDIEVSEHSGSGKEKTISDETQDHLNETADDSKTEKTRHKLVNKIQYELSDVLNNVVYKCTLEDCGEFFPSQKLLKIHMKNIHGQNLAYVCSICNNGYSVMGSLRIHIHQSHLNVKRVMLTIGGAEMYLKDRITINGKFSFSYTKEKVIQEVLICSMCGALGTDETLDNHHCQPKGQTYYCPFCPKETCFNTDSEKIREHIREYHVNTTETRDLKDSLDVPVTVGNDGQVEQSAVLEREEAEPKQDQVIRAEESFPCVHCHQLFASEFDKTIHELTHTGLRLQHHVCGQCGNSYPRLSAFKKHAMSHREYMYKCDQCDRAFQEQSDFDRHANTHSGNRPYQCDICGNRYCDDKACKRHMKNKHTKVYYERYCGNSGKSQGSEEQSYFCEHCGQIFSNTKQWNNHNVSYHGQQKKVVACSLCPDRSFKTKRILDKHMLRHKHVELLDDKAKENVKQPDPRLQLHEEVKVAIKDRDSLKLIYDKLRIVNKNDKDGLPYTCGICSKKFKKVKFLNLHIRASHTDDESKKFRCTVCGKGFVRVQSLRSHMRVHTKSRPYRCRLCSKAFKQVGHVKEHLMSHSTKCTAKCRICGKVFKLNGSMKAHIVSHSKLKPFKCPVCPQAFQDIYRLNDHFSNIDHDGGKNNGTTKTYTCHMCIDFQTDKKSCMVKHLENHTIDKPFKCEICAERYCKFLDLYSHKVKFSHFVKSDFEGVKKINNPYISNPGKVEIFDNYSIEELLTLYVYEPDGAELSRPELEDMINPDGIEYDEDYLYKRQKKKWEMQVREPGMDLRLTEKWEMKVTQPGMDLSHLEYKEESSACLPETTADIVYDDDLLSVAEQLTHMADSDPATYTEVVIPSNEEEIGADFQMTSNQVLIAAAENSIAVSANANQLPSDSSYKISLSRNDKTALQSQTQRNSLHHQDFKAFHTGNNTDIIEKAVYSHRYDKTSSATNTLIQQNCISIENIAVEKETKELVTATTKSLVQQTNASNQTSVATTKPVVQQTYNVIDQSGNEIIVCILNETTEDTQLSILESEGNNNLANIQENVSVPGINKVVFKSTDHGTTDFDRTQSCKGLGKEQLDATISNKQLDLSQLSASTSTNTYIVKDEKSHVNETISSDNTIKDLFEKECFYMLDEAEQGEKNLETTDHDDDNVLEKRTNFFHKKNENTGNFPCDVCGKRFQSVKLKNCHKKVHLPDHLRKFRCNECGKGFNRPMALEIHARLHSGIKMYECEYCGRKFTQLGHLTTHKVTHRKEKPFKCNQCSWSGTTRSNLRKHLLHTHEGEKKWKCDKCDKAYVSKNDLRRHSVLHLSSSARLEIIAKTSLKPVSEDTISEDKMDSCQKSRKPTSDVPKYVCDVCGKGYMQSNSLAYHKSTHETGNSFKCKECAKRFPTEKALKIHEKSHSSSIPCDRCGKLLKTRKGVEYHIAAVHGVQDQSTKPNYTCKKCQRGFNKSSSFLCHVAVCHA